MKRVIYLCGVFGLLFFFFIQTTFIEAADGATLSDIASHKNRTAIQYLYNKGVISGYPDGTFKPNNTLNRAELLKMLVGGKNIQVTLEQGYKNCFPDVGEEWFAPYVCYAKAEAWINGYPDGTFQPAKIANKAEALKMLVQSQGYGIPQHVEAMTFSDVDIHQWYAPYIKVAQEKDLLEETGSFFYPTSYIKRAGIAENLYRAMMIWEENSEVKIVSVEKENGEELFWGREKMDVDELGSNNIWRGTETSYVKSEWIGVKTEGPIEKVTFSYDDYEYVDTEPNPSPSSDYSVSFRVPQSAKNGDIVVIYILAEGSGMRDNAQVPIYVKRIPSAEDKIEEIVMLTTDGDVVGGLSEDEPLFFNETGQEESVFAVVTFDDGGVYEAHSDILKNVEWHVGNENVARYDLERGLIAVDSGKTEVWVEIEGIHSKRIPVEVLLTKDAEMRQLYMLFEGSEYGINLLNNQEPRNFEVYVSYSNGTLGEENIAEKVQWASSNDEIIEVSETGEIRAKSDGIAVIMAYYHGVIGAEYFTVAGVKKQESSEVPFAEFTITEKLDDISAEVFFSKFILEHYVNLNFKMVTEGDLPLPLSKDSKFIAAFSIDPSDLMLDSSADITLHFNSEDLPYSDFDNVSLEYYEPAFQDYVSLGSPYGSVSKYTDEEERDPYTLEILVQKLGLMVLTEKIEEDP